MITFNQQRLTELQQSFPDHRPLTYSERIKLTEMFILMPSWDVTIEQGVLYCMEKVLRERFSDKD